MSKAKLITFIAALGLLYMAADPYITVYKMKSAAEAHDGEALSEYIEFSSVRQSLKDQMNHLFAKMMSENEELSNNPFAGLGAAFSGVVIDKIVDAYITPAAIASEMSGERSNRETAAASPEVQGRKPLSDATMGYESMNKFVVNVKGETGAEVKYVLRRRGMRWKLTEILLPLDDLSAPPSMTPAARRLSPLTLKTIALSPSNGKAKADVTYLQVASVPAGVNAGALNRELQKLVAGGDVSIESRISGVLNLDSCDGDCELSIDMNAAYNNNGILAVTLDVYEITGGAHGMPDKRCANFDTVTGRRLELSDFLVPDHKKHLDILVRKELEKDHAEDLIRYEGINNNFLVSQKGLTFVFNVYEIAPYSAGILEASLSWSQISALVRTDGRLQLPLK